MSKKKAAKKKAVKKRSGKHSETKLKIIGTLDDVLRVSIPKKK
ncbi:MAG: hypothetical protein V4635_14245 [Bacteroidota bacterium]